MNNIGRWAGLALTVVLLTGASACSSTPSSWKSFADPNRGWQVELPGTVTTQANGNVTVYSARYGRDYYAIVDATMGAGLTVNLDDDANNAIDSTRNALGAVASQRVITATTVDGFEARSFSADLASGNDSATLTGVIVSHNGHVVSAIVTDTKSNSAADVTRFIASFTVL